MKKLFAVQEAVPAAFDSIPVLNNQNATFYYFVGERKEHDIDDLWGLFEAALNYASNPISEKLQSFSEIFDLVIHKKGNGNSKITMGLYWIAPHAFLNLDSRNEWYIYESGKVPDSVVSSLPAIESKISAAKYFEIIEPRCSLTNTRCIFVVRIYNKASKVRKKHLCDVRSFHIAEALPL